MLDKLCINIIPLFARTVSTSSYVSRLYAAHRITGKGLEILASSGNSQDVSANLFVWIRCDSCQWSTCLHGMADIRQWVSFAKTPVFYITVLNLQSGVILICIILDPWAQVRGFADSCMGKHIHNVTNPFVQFDDNFGFFLLHFITKWNVSRLWFLTPYATNMQSASLFIPLWCKSFSLLSLSLPFSKKLKEEKTPSWHHLPCHSPLRIFLLSSPIAAQERQLLLLHWLFQFCSPTFPIFQFLLPAKLTTLILSFFLCRKYYFIFCNLLFQEIFVNIIEIIRCPGCEIWRHSMGIFSWLICM